MSFKAEKRENMRDQFQKIKKEIQNNYQSKGMGSAKGQSEDSKHDSDVQRC